MTKRPATLNVMRRGVKVGEIPNTGDGRIDAAAVRKVLKDAGLYAPTTPFQAIFRQAVSFCTTSKYLYERDLMAMPANFFSIAPFVTNAAFAIELYLKTLSHAFGKDQRGHELVRLYDNLPSTAIEAIKAQIPIAAQEWEADPTLPFRDSLEALNKAFLVWRYLHEYESTEQIHIKHVIFVLKVLHEACLAHERSLGIGAADSPASGHAT